MISYVNLITIDSFIFQGLKDGKKCVTEFWLSDVIGEQKIKKPWLPHHFPIPYR